MRQISTGLRREKRRHTKLSSPLKVLEKIATLDQLEDDTYRGSCQQVSDGFLMYRLTDALILIEDLFKQANVLVL